MERTLQTSGDQFYLVDEYFAGRIRAAGLNHVVVVAQETAKSLDRIPEIVARMRQLGVSRDTTLVAIGGGVIQDIAGFVASIYMRGIRWMYVPSTLLGMADSCIGGKSSINVGSFKNIVGTFYPPMSIEIDPTLTQTLSSEQRVAGLCEIAKICYCRGPESFSQYLALGPTPSSGSDRLAQAIGLSLGAKKWFIEVDEFDRGERLLLNFGHTFGHAIEAASDFRICHGVAVGLGMLAALRLSLRLRRSIEPGARARGLAEHVAGLLNQAPGLDEQRQAMRLGDLMNAFEADKKLNKSRYSVIVVGDADAVERMSLPRTEETFEAIQSAFQYVVHDRFQTTARP
jgi:3-dehydroquinate synthase